MTLIEAAEALKSALAPLSFAPPITHVYNPLEYAWERHCEYLERYGSGQKRVVFLGMNPGPWGMAQCGVPFGEIASVRDWMGIQGAVGEPVHEHPKRPVEGFACERSEVSGRRLWGLFAEHFGSAESFFEQHFVANYCPLVWMAETGRNITPDKIPKSEMAAVELACMKHLTQVLLTLQPEILIGVGAYATKKLQQVVKNAGLEPQLIASMIHPSPASPIANRDWPERPAEQLRRAGVL